jgi:hypothetical protein
MNCGQKDALLAAYRNSTALYSMAVRQLSQIRATPAREGYDDVSKLTEYARRICECDWRELERHVNYHGC